MDNEVDLTADLSQFQLPTDFQVPVTHEAPKNTLDSLVQIKNEFSQKVAEATAKNDSSKLRRYQRQLKQFEDAIKATKEGKSFNYGELTVPPGFAPIPLNNGKPITSSSLSVPSKSTGGSSPQRVSSFNLNNHSKARPVIEERHEENEIVDDDDDDILNKLEQEIDDNDDDIELDPEEEKFNHLINSATKHIPKLDKMLPKGAIPDDLESQLNNFRIPETTKPKTKQEAPSQPSIQQPGANRPSKSPNFDTEAVGGIDPNVIKSHQPNVRPMPTVNQAKKPQNKDLQIILERQRLFKEAALKAKQDGNVKVALVYLRHSKGFDNMIIAAENGLPLDMSNLPVPPQLENKVKSASTNVKNANVSPTSVVIIKSSDEPISGDRKTVFKRLQDDLVEQINLATANFKHFTNMGDVNNATKFNQIARESIQDLESLKNAYSIGESVPLYHYEKRSYQTIDCNSDLTDNDLEINIIRAINLPLPKDFEAKDLSTYIKFEFPYPPEQSQVDKTNKHSGTGPEYNQVFKLQIQRKNTKFMRLMNRKDLKLEIYYKAGFLKGDKLLGTCLVKLQHLENSSTIHDAFDLLEGKKQIGGKLELKLRIREPLLHKEVKILEYKWLIIDKFNVNKSSSSAL